MVTDGSIIDVKKYPDDTPALNTECIVIENKLKSYPTQEQLIKYQNYFKDKKSTFILLSLVPNFEVPKAWQYISYENLAEKLSHISEFKNQYDEFLITDYINVVKLIANAFPKLSTQKYDLYENNKLDEIGLKDIYIKYRTSELCNFINKNTNLSVTVDFRDKQGIINVWCSFENYNITFLIQIQNNEYRYCLIYGNESENELRESIATILTKNNIWFNNCIENYPKARNYQSKKFCGYKPNFIYRYQTLEKVFGKIKMSDISYKEIAEKVNNDISDLLKHKSEIVNHVIKNNNLVPNGKNIQLTNDNEVKMYGNQIGIKKGAMIHLYDETGKHVGQTTAR